MKMSLQLDGATTLPGRPNEQDRQQDIVRNLNTVFRWQNANAYACYLLDLPGIDLKLVDSNVGDIGNIRQSGKSWRPYPGLTDERARIQLSIPQSMYPLPPRYQICVNLDTLGAVVPASAAAIVSAGFAAGLVARLMLLRFGDRTTTNFVSELDTLASQAPQTMVTNYGSTPAEFERRFATVAKEHAFQPSGIFLGWNAAHDLQTADANVRDAIWRLVHSRFQWADIGELTGYTLSYIVGYLRSQAALREANVRRNAGGIADPNQILAKLRDDPRINSIENVLATFFNRLMSGFQKATRVSARDQRVQNYCDFLIGYQRGCIRGASDVFDLTLSVAYGIGYQDGFRVGYARGYADGYQAGYKDGQDVNWASVLHDVATIIDDAATVIAVFA